MAVPPPTLLATPVLSWLQIESIRCPVNDDDADINPGNCVLDAVVNNPGDVIPVNGFAYSSGSGDEVPRLPALSSSSAGLPQLPSSSVPYPPPAVPDPLLPPWTCVIGGLNAVNSPRGSISDEPVVDPRRRLDRSRPMDGLISAPLTSPLPGGWCDCGCANMCFLS